MIAEKILEGRIIKFPADEEMPGEAIKHNVLSAMQSYADFFYWMGKEGLEVYDGWDRWIEPKSKNVYNIQDLYDDFITNWKPKEP